MQPIDRHFEAAKKVFNNIRVMKGEFTSIATCDDSGNPNVAPIGSMRIMDDHTIHVLQGFLPRTHNNLKMNPKAVFAVRCRDSLVKKLFSFIKDPEDEVMGYRVYGSLTQISDSKAVLQREIKAISPRVPWLFRKSFHKFCDARLNHLWVFSLDDIRIIGGIE